MLFLSVTSSRLAYTNWIYVFRKSVLIRYTLKHDFPRLFEPFIGSITTIGSVSNSELVVICFAKPSYR